ncbi:hypothetical protein PMAYCL1PPCAC_09954 [Pristionchus mayeri]|uniref:Uncharacterized protein n=1 Tax=Pristionchus mayeri TaxID=1317129 RepID=A0AAN4ZH00_9BILA|nr:hypothetical protein PMAYCL1PPCAC_09954 [Pristionchus mayeri]
MFLWMRPPVGTSTWTPTVSSQRNGQEEKAPAGCLPFSGALMIIGSIMTNALIFVDVHENSVVRAQAVASMMGTCVAGLLVVAVSSFIFNVALLGDHNEIRNELFYDHWWSIYISIFMVLISFINPIGIYFAFKFDSQCLIASAILQIMLHFVLAFTYKPLRKLRTQELDQYFAFFVLFTTCIIVYILLQSPKFMEGTGKEALAQKMFWCFLMAGFLNTMFFGFAYYEKSDDWKNLGRPPAAAAATNRPRTAEAVATHSFFVPARAADAAKNLRPTTSKLSNGPHRGLSLDSIHSSSGVMGRPLEHTTLLMPD